MGWILDGLIVWGAVSVPVSLLLGHYLARISEQQTKPMPRQSVAESRTEQHKFDAENNPNYRGGYK